MIRILFCFPKSDNMEELNNYVTNTFIPRTKQELEEFERIVQRQGGTVKLLEGYGLTEAVTAIMATPIDHYREGSMGVPFSDMNAKI